MATTMERPGTEPVHPKPKRKAPWPVEFYRSAVGKKWVMALTGIMLMGFVFFHAFGNLKVYLGARHMNEYGEFLRTILVPLLPRTVFLWIMRTGLTLAFIFHIHSAYSLTRMNKRARGTGYEQSRDWQAANIASKSMRWTGVIVGLFVIFHLSDLTWGITNPNYVRGDVYRNLLASFSRPGHRDHLHRRQPGPVHPPVPRRLVDVPEPRAQQPEVELLAQELRHRLRHDHRRR